MGGQGRGGNVSNVVGKSLSFSPRLSYVLCMYVLDGLFVFVFVNLFIAVFVFELRV